MCLAYIKEDDVSSYKSVEEREKDMEEEPGSGKRSNAIKRNSVCKHCNKEIVYVNDIVMMVGMRGRTGIYHRDCIYYKDE